MKRLKVELILVCLFMFTAIACGGGDPYYNDGDPFTYKVARVETVEGGNMSDMESVAGVLRHRVIEIGNWDMDASPSVNVSLPSGVDFNSIRGVEVLIKIDDGSSITPLSYETEPTTGDSGFCGYALSDGQIVLHRTTGGGYDNSLYDSTPFNRGWVTIWYV